MTLVVRAADHAGRRDRTRAGAWGRASADRAGESSGGVVCEVWRVRGRRHEPPARLQRVSAAVDIRLRAWSIRAAGIRPSRAASASRRSLARRWFPPVRRGSAGTPARLRPRALEHLLERRLQRPRSRPTSASASRAPARAAAAPPACRASSRAPSGRRPARRRRTRQRPEVRQRRDLLLRDLDRARAAPRAGRGPRAALVRSSTASSRR